MKASGPVPSESRAGRRDDPGRILVVEDDAMNRLALSRALEIRGHDVHAVVDGVDAMEALRAGPFDLVLLDMQMPRKNGFETLAEIKADPVLRELPVIVISGLEDTAERGALHRDGCARPPAQAVRAGPP